MRFVLASIIFLASYTWSSAALAQARVALIIGNSAYTNTTPLKNPKNDATLFAAALRNVGFDVILETDLGLKPMQRAIRTYIGKLNAGGRDAVGLIYYAGHGLQVDGINYLVPVDANIDRESDVAIESVSAADVLKGLRLARNNLNIIILDACRNNPFRGFSRGASRGLARLDAPQGSYVVFATAPGDVAADGDGNNSPFSQALATHFTTPGLNVEQIIKRVGRQVSRVTGGRQRPWLSSSVYDDFFPAGRGVGKWATVARPSGTAKPAAATVQSKPAAAATTAKAVQAPGLIFRDCKTCPEMIVVPAGRFTMGSLNDRFRDRDQTPSREVTIARPFAVGRFEITFDQWDACRRARGCARYNPSDEKWGRGRRPVIRVNWQDAITYVEWLKHTTGKPYRLLSEAEWEYVARAGTTTLFSTGDTLTTYQANFDGRRSYNSGPKGDYLAQTREVGNYKPNPFGVFDMHGNVSEWLSDCWHKTYEGAPTDGSSWRRPPRSHRCHRRSVRGGSWFRGARYLRSSARNSLAPHIRSYEVGFRVARDLN